MSSPFIPQHSDYTDRRLATSPAPSTESFSEVPSDTLRRMKLKVHYTFDNENKANHLVRYRDEVKVRTAFLDENTQVGVIELKTCIKAIVNASPELVARLGQDYTIYAYDYSEYETPLVGQGMLSWVLASSKPSTPAEQSSTMVTGRVCRNLGLFGMGAPETLEVKLRLVPVPTSLQSEYIDSMNKYRELSMVMPEEFDFQSWNGFLQANPGILSVLQNGKGGSRPTSSAGSSGNIGLEHVQRLMNHGYIPSNGQDQTMSQQIASFPTFDGNTGGTRYSSPAPSVSSTRPPARVSLSRSMSRTSNYPDQSRGVQESSNGPLDSGYISNDERADEGRPKKRAKVTQANHPGKSSLGKKADSLRVAASAAASLRVHQPTAVRPSGNPVSNLEEPPRAPTPIPQTANQLRRPRLPSYRSKLGRESYSAADSGYKSPYLTPKDPPSLPNSAITSPETDHVPNMEDSPQEPGSSPPVMLDNAIYQSSPALPPLRIGDESALASGPLDELSAEEDDDVNRPINAEDIEIAKQYSIRPELAKSSGRHDRASTVGAQLALTSEKAPRAQTRQELSHTRARSAVGHLKRSSTWSGEATPSDPASDTNAAKDTEDAAMSPKEGPRGKSHHTKWDKDKRKAAVQSKLSKAIEVGELPPFCEVCGAIETPTWRKAFSKVYSGSAEGVKVAKGDGKIVCCQVLEKNEDGTTKLFKVFKKSLLEADEGFAEFLLCNPCGLWLANRNMLRPENLWTINNDREQKKKERAKGRPPRPSRSKKRRPSAQPTSDMPESQFDAPSDALAAGLQDESGESPLEPGNLTETEKLDEPDLPQIRRAEGGGGHGSELLQQEISPQNLLDPSAYAALERAIKSSPNRFQGSKSSPINVDEGTPDPARRTLFSSPKTSGPLGIDANRRDSARPEDSIVSDSVQNGQATAAEMAQADLVSDFGHGTLPARSASPDPFGDLSKALAPVTPSKANKNPAAKTPSDIFKTPSQKSSHGHHRISTDDFFSSAAKAFLHGPSTPSRTPSKIRAQSLDQMTPFTRGLNTILSDAMGQENSPSKFFGILGDVRALPPLTNDHGSAMDFDFSDFNPTSDLGLTSSPPRWFGLADDATEGGLWEDVGLGSSPAKASEKEAEAAQELTATPTAA